MKRRILTGVTLFAALALTACSSSDHVLQMKDGRTVVVQGKPSRDDATGMVIYTDEKGQQQAVNQNDIKEMSSIDD